MTTEASIDTSLEFTGKVAIVTGASGGVGGALVRLLLQRGGRVVAQDLKDDVGDLERADPERVAHVVGDAADSEVARAAVATAVSRFGRLDVLVSNAGRTLNKPVTETTDEDWDAVLRTNARGGFVQSREAFRHMADHGGGSIVFVGSYASTVALPEGSAYASSKGALGQLAKVLAIEGARRGIRANEVAAGVIDTGFLDTIRPDGQEYLRSFGDSMPMGRIARPEEIAEAVLWLASERASYVTGAVLAADGGFTAQ
ncbi:MAG: 3-oxoacyl-[acyl-carrier protein] reductase [uncultured Rubrobacteraceae bacterium]|uniref:3-oxoacyl-[acyl-carrier protein] reductase n=1 Tax=uncultured Rubrobacteraceae bacterium TaxID=349277 RepID=A0A6J4R971_9ACTN|nr:MAG: 3-oxoacyl-[acyl-carrier protein] reductase [uncultured Rubrobacteraceae bacterium]